MPLKKYPQDSPSCSNRGFFLCVCEFFVGLLAVSLASINCHKHQNVSKYCQVSPKGREGDEVALDGGLLIQSCTLGLLAGSWWW